MSPVLFYLVCGVIIIPALAVVVSENLFHAGLSMIVSFLGIAAVYAMLSAPFLAAVQVLVYAGAIAVILLFAFMLTHNIMLAQEAPGRARQISAGAICLLLFGLMGRVLMASGWSALVPGTSEPVGLELLGTELLTNALVPFELISVLLLMTLIGAVVIARKEEKQEP